MPSRSLYSPNIVRLVHVHLQDFVAVHVRACLTIALPLTIPSSFPLHFTLTDAFTRRLAYQPALRHDMENAPTAIMLSRLRTFLRTVGRIALIPDDHVTSSHLNGLRPVTPSDMFLHGARRRSWVRNRISRLPLAYISFWDSWKAACYTGTRYIRPFAIISSSEPMSSSICVRSLGNRRYS